MNRLRHIRFLFTVVLLVLAAGITSSCGSRTQHEALLRAEALMESDPRAARAVLDSLAEAENLPSSILHQTSDISHPPSYIFHLPSKRDAALYALLRTQADYKCRIRLTSDSLPLIATNYFGTRRKTQLAALSQYYLGCAYGDMHRDLDAIDALLRATTLFPDTTNKYYANSLFELGLLYLNHHMPDSALISFSRYRQTEACNSDSVNIGYADYYMGSAALYKGDDDLADSLFRCVELNRRNSSFLINNTYYQLAKLYYNHKHDIEKSLAYLNKVGDYFGEENGAVLSLKADILTEQKQFPQAFELYRKAIRNTSDIHTQCSSYEGLAELAPLVNKVDSARFFIQEYKALLDTIIARSQKEKIAEVKDKHIVELHDQQLKARQARFLFRIGIAAVVLVSGIAIVFLLVDRRRKKRYMQAQEELRQANVEFMWAQADETTADMDALYQKKLGACQNLFRQTPSARLLMMSPSSLTASERQKLMDDLTRSFVDIMMDVKNASNAVNDQEVMYSILSSLRCSTAQIAELLNTTESTLRTRKSRIKEKMPSNLYSLFFS